MTKELNEKQFFIIKKAKYIGYQIYDNKAFDLTSAVRKLLALDELNETMLAEELGHASVKTTVEIYVAPAHRDRIRKGSQRKL